ncbi:murein biosynthesis integral membrane protein MurJ [Phenylobacterium sp. SCN 70-31]|uniref:murein biosynthesis integral membrane protein MurJ n=1 Tax=Phenylobacterium sp. SCN 70-31 TaxID=1660129 RepID=UPI00086B1A93|nr:murein biosynthesis integral membrane protein MurJ [Phenylobacterium sp. SCN 70-31]ODT87775.1 MAG: murein biosynthesis integral membrane protein MurJ [Phenylobacterium sp. SCN 70-31]
MTETATPSPAPPAPAPGPAPKRSGGLLRSSAIFSGLTLVSRVMGLVRDLVVTARLGASATIAADAYYTALAFPNLFRRIFAEGAFAAAFVPAYSRRLAGEGEADADRFAADALATVAVATVAVMLVAQLAMPWLMYVINPGYADEPEKFRLAWMLTQVTMPYLPCMAIAALFSGVLNARGKFIVSAAYPTVLNLVMLAVVLPQTDPVRAAWWASAGVVIAGIGQAGICWWGARRSGARLRLVRPRLTPEMKALVTLAVPAAIANSATQINIFISGILASQIAGMRVWMNVADRLYQLPMSLVGVAIGVALLPRLSQALQRDDHDDAQAAMDQGIVFALALSLPAAAALMALPVYLIDGLFTRDQFTAVDAAATGQLLFHYGWGVPAFVLLRILQPAFFARQDTRTPMRFSLISVGVNIVLGIALFYAIGFQGVAIATSVAAWISVLQMWVALTRRGDWRPSPQTASRIVRIALASAALGGALFAANLFRAEIEAAVGAVAPFGVKEISIVLVCSAGLALYPALLFAFGGLTPAEAKAALRRRRGDPPAAPADLS